MKRRLREIGRRLREEEARFIDYAAIERKTAELGFPTSVRTIRFYVSEGVLPPPKKRGKTPVYEEEWIVPALLAIHLMKTRLHRSLAEIRAIFENLAEPPEALVERCHALYEEGGDGSRLSRAAYGRLLDRFFGALTGAAARDGRPRQPSEIRITELLREIGGEEDEEPAPLAGFGFHYDPSGAGPAPGARAAGAGEDEPPEGAVTPLRAKDLEDAFIRGFERKFCALGRVRPPGSGRAYSTRASARDPQISDAYLRVAEILKAERRFDRELFDRLPLDKATCFRLPPRRGRRPDLVIVGAATSPIEALVRQGWARDAAGARELDALIARLAPEPPTFAVLGLLSTTGWDPSLRARPPRGETWRVALVEPAPGGGWSIAHALDGSLAVLAPIFDPEPEEEKIERCLARALALPALAPRGALLEIEDLAAVLGIDAALAEEVVRRALARDGSLRLVEVEGRRVLKRVRF